MAYQDAREWIHTLEKEGELLTVNEEIDPHLEIGAVGYLTRLGKASLFTFSVTITLTSILSRQWRGSPYRIKKIPDPKHQILNKFQAPITK